MKRELAPEIVRILKGEHVEPTAMMNLYELSEQARIIWTQGVDPLTGEELGLLEETNLVEFCGLCSELLKEIANARP